MNSLKWVAMVAAVAALGCGDENASATNDGGNTGSGGSTQNPSGGGGSGAGVAAGELEQCLIDGGGIDQVEVINNNIAFMHGNITTLAVSDAGLITVASSDGAVKWWTVLGESEGSTEVGYNSAQGEGTDVVRVLAYGSDNWLVAGDEAGLVQRWDTETFSISSELVVGSDPVTALAVDANGGVVAVADNSFGGNINLWSQDGAQPNQVLESQLWNVEALAFLPTGALVSAGHVYGMPTVEIRDAADPATVIGAWDDGQGSVHDLAISADGSTIVVVGSGFVAVVASDSPSEALAVTFDPEHDALSVTLLPGEEHFATVGADGSLRVWRLDSAEVATSVPLAGAVGVGRELGTNAMVTATTDGMIQVQRCVTP